MYELRELKALSDTLCECLELKDIYLVRLSKQYLSKSLALETFIFLQRAYFFLSALNLT